MTLFCIKFCVYIGKLLGKKLPAGYFWVVNQVQSKECCLCLSELSTPQRSVNAKRALFMYHYCQLILNPKHDKLCDSCHNLPIKKLTVQEPALLKIEKLHISHDIKQKNK